MSTRCIHYWSVVQLLMMMWYNAIHAQGLQYLNTSAPIPGKLLVQILAGGIYEQATTSRRRQNNIPDSDGFETHWQDPQVHKRSRSAIVSTVNSDKNDEKRNKLGYIVGSIFKCSIGATIEFYNILLISNRLWHGNGCCSTTVEPDFTNNSSTHVAHYIYLSSSLHQHYVIKPQGVIHNGVACDPSQMWGWGKEKPCKQGTMKVLVGQN